MAPACDAHLANTSSYLFIGMKTGIPVVLDVDPGHDDALAIILAGFYTNLLLVSTVAGNQSLEKVTINALNMLEVAGMGHVPVVAGAARPLVRPPVHCPEIHGDSGLDAMGGRAFPPLPAGRAPLKEKAINVMAATIMGHHQKTGEKVTLIATGALTNVALLLSVYPEVKDSLEKIVTMGGAIGLGNTSPAAEFNCEIDPEACAVVLGCGLPVSITPLEVTHTALVTREVLARIAATGGEGSAAGAASAALASRTPFRDLIINLLMFFSSAYNDTFGMPDPPLHDPCAVLLAVAPELFETKTCGVYVETGAGVCAGRTVVDLLGMRKGVPGFNPVTVALKMDVPRFWDAMCAAIDAADAKSVLNAAA